MGNEEGDDGVSVGRGDGGEEGRRMEGASVEEVWRFYPFEGRISDRVRHDGSTNTYVART